MDILHTLNDQQLQQLHALYQNEWWSGGRTLEDTRRCAEGSSLIFGFVQEGNLLAYARVITDYVFKAFIFDVIVSPALRGQGIGNLIVNTIKSHPDLQRVGHLELYCRADMIPYYESHGFTAALGDLHLMRFDRRSTATQ